MNTLTSEEIKEKKTAYKLLAIKRLREMQTDVKARHEAEYRNVKDMIPHMKNVFKPQSHLMASLAEDIYFCTTR